MKTTILAGSTGNWNSNGNRDKNDLGTISFVVTEDTASDAEKLPIRLTDAEEGNGIWIRMKDAVFVVKKTKDDECCNKDTLSYHLAETVYVVEATNCEKLFLWKETKDTVKWESINSGFGFTVGHIADMPVVVSFTFAIINNKKVMFYEATSQVVDYRMIEDWICKYVPVVVMNCKRDTCTDASNFHQCLHTIKIINEQKNIIKPEDNVIITEECSKCNTTFRKNELSVNYSSQYRYLCSSCEEMVSDT